MVTGFPLISINGVDEVTDLLLDLIQGVGEVMGSWPRTAYDKYPHISSSRPYKLEFIINMSIVHSFYGVKVP